MSRFTRNRLKRKQAQAELERRGNEFSQMMQQIANHPEEFIASVWKNIWQLPLHKDKHSDYVWSSNGNMALSSFKEEWEYDDEMINKIVLIINGETPSDFLPKWKAEGCDILYQDEYAFCVRGWGHLTGSGALHLPEDTAAIIQDGFISYIVDKLNNNN